MIHFKYFNYESKVEEYQGTTGNKFDKKTILAEFLI